MSSEQRVSTVVHTHPGWRVLSVGLAAGAAVAGSLYLAEIGHADDVATVVVIMAVYSISHWARRRPDRLSARVGPFGKIARAVVESQDDLTSWALAKPLRVGLLLGAGYGTAVVLAKSAVAAVVAGLWSWQLAVAVGCAVAAVVAAPELIGGLVRRVAGTPDAPTPDRDRDRAAEHLRGAQTSHDPSDDDERRAP